MSENQEQQQEEAGVAEAEAVGTAVPSEAPDAPETGSGRNARKQRVGVVVSDKGDKTVIVEVARQFAHPLYGKQVARTKRYPAHDENNEYLTGDRVRIMETRPLSRTKHWRVIELIERPE